MVQPCKGANRRPIYEKMSIPSFSLLLSKVNRSCAMKAIQFYQNFSVKHKHAYYVGLSKLLKVVIVQPLNPEYRKLVQYNLEKTRSYIFKSEKSSTGYC